MQVRVADAHAVEELRASIAATTDSPDKESSVDLLKWPDETGLRRELSERGRPCLMLIDEAAPPPPSIDILEDWVRLPALEVDVMARMRTLSDRAASLRQSTPLIDDDGVLRFQDKWVHVPPLERRIADVLVDNFGAVVSRENLTDAGWPDQHPGRNALDVHVLRLRRRLVRVHMSIRTVRSRGYLLESAG